MMDACQWYKSSPTGPAEHDDGGSLLVLVMTISHMTTWKYRPRGGRWEETAECCKNTQT